ncbi:PDZ domain-containing protein [Virgibacillus flavescens]|uniref:PDZ domain-containing protein n=1 Tax=Virgibacillus flavescens TaxID=1611422 RepID=UPI003D349C25
MADAWSLELIKGIGKLFLNPLTYWIVILLVLAGLRRTRRERINFGSKISDVFSECKGTWLTSLVAGLLISGICIGVGLVFTYETLALLCIVTILLSIALRFTMLSPSYTIGFTLFILLFMPTVIDNQSYFNADLFSEINFTGVSLLIGLFLFVEAGVTHGVRKNQSFPDLQLSSRGKWFGFHHIKKLSVIPFFTLVPSGLITPFAAYWPSVSLDGESYGLILFPFIVGFDHTVKSVIPEIAAQKLGKQIYLLGTIVLCIAIGSIYMWSLSIVAAVVAIIGREYITYRHRGMERKRQSLFNRNHRGLSIIAIKPHTPAERLDINIGEIVSKVNGQPVQDVEEFYYYLQKSGAFFKLEVLDLAGEVRLIQSALYQNDHHELGLVFVKERYHSSEKIKKVK